MHVDRTAQRREDTRRARRPPAIGAALQAQVQHIETVLFALGRAREKTPDPSDEKSVAHARRPIRPEPREPRRRGVRVERARRLPVHYPGRPEVQNRQHVVRIRRRRRHHRVFIPAVRGRRVTHLVGETMMPRRLAGLRRHNVIHLLRRVRIRSVRNRKEVARSVPVKAERIPDSARDDLNFRRRRLRVQTPHHASGVHLAHFPEM